MHARVPLHLHRIAHRTDEHRAGRIRISRRQAEQEHGIAKSVRVPNEGCHILQHLRHSLLVLRFYIYLPVLWIHCLAFPPARRLERAPVQRDALLAADLRPCLLRAFLHSAKARAEEIFLRIESR